MTALCLRTALHYNLCVLGLILGSCYTSIGRDRNLVVYLYFMLGMLVSLYVLHLMNFEHILKVLIASGWVIDCYGNPN